MNDIVSVERIASKIYVIRHLKVMLDKDLADLYGVETRVLNQAVKRHERRFPDDFMFQLSKDEYESLISQFVTSKISGRGGVRKMPHVFTEQGIAMLSGVLNSDRAIAANIQIMRTFTKLREVLLNNDGLRRELEEFKQITEERFLVVFETLDKLLQIEDKPKRKIGFTVKEKVSAYRKNKLATAANGFSLTPHARKLWEAIPGEVRVKLLNNVWCADCRKSTGISEATGSVEKGALVLKGQCTTCGGKVARLIESD